MLPTKLAGALPPKDDAAELGGFSKPGQFSKPGGYTPVPGELSAKSQQAQKFEHSVKGNLSATIDVNAPRGTKAKASGDSLIRQVKLNRTMAGEASPATSHASEGEE